MGALHAGHLALIAAAREENRFVLATIFVNPLQFGPHEDFTHYPRPFARDAALLAEAGVDLLFHPSAQELYPPGFATTVAVAGMTERLEGAARPGHFSGVTTVVTKLFAITQPDRAYFGQKDAQQVAVLRRLVTDLNLPIVMRAVPTVREPDGLALSSRNAYLSAGERAAAPALYRGLVAAREQWRAGACDPEVLRTMVRMTVAHERLLQLEYIEVVAAETMEPLVAPLPRAGGLLVAAANCGRTRLIDNLPL
jgi:pantoate--beta-alanine ligase